MANSFKITARMNKKDRAAFERAFEILTAHLKLDGIDFEIRSSSESGTYYGIAYQNLTGYIRNTQDREQMMGTLAHELRHLWQYQTGILEGDSWIGKEYRGLKHKDRPWEKDAYDFERCVGKPLAQLLN